MRIEESDSEPNDSPIQATKKVSIAWLCFNKDKAFKKMVMTIWGAISQTAGRYKYQYGGTSNIGIKICYLYLKKLGQAQANDVIIKQEE